jgi:hypothetical protein
VAQPEKIAAKVNAVGNKRVICPIPFAEDRTVERETNNQERRSVFMASALCVANAVPLCRLYNCSCDQRFSDDLQELKATSVNYVASMKAALALSDEADCSETVARANEYAAAKVAYHKTARRAMPALLELAKGQETNSVYGNELTEIFRGCGEDRDEVATGTLEAKLRLCPNSKQRDQARLAITQAKETAEQFIKDFGQLDGV